MGEARAQAGSGKPEVFTRDYLKAYDAALASSKTPEELQAKVEAQYPGAALDIVLKIGSEASLKPASKTAKK